MVSASPPTSEGMLSEDSGAAPVDATGAGWASEMLKNLQQASDEALEIFYSAFNVSGAGAGAGAGARAGAADGLGWGSVSEEGEGRKQFFFGDPSEYDLSDINGPRSQVRAALIVWGQPRASSNPMFRACAGAKNLQGAPDVPTCWSAQWSLFKNNVKGFVQAIEWTEPWLIGLACFHVVLLVTAVRGSGLPRPPVVLQRCVTRRAIAWM